MSNDDRSLGEERVDDRAVGYGVAAALRRHCLEHPLEPSQIGNFAADFAHMIARQLFDLSAGVGAAVDEAEQFADLLNREAEIAAAPDKVEAPDQTLPVETVPAGGAGRRRQQAYSLVIADRLDIAAGAGGERATRQRLAARGALSLPCGCWRELTQHRKKALEPVSTTGTNLSSGPIQ